MNAHQNHPFKSRSGWRRVVRAWGYSVSGLKAAYRYEAAFRQELGLGVPLIGVACFAAPGPTAMAMMVGTILMVWVVELLNSAIETLADAMSTAEHPLLGRAKDIGSAAVMTTIGLAVTVWTILLWPR